MAKKKQKKRVIFGSDSDDEATSDNNNTSDKFDAYMKAKAKKVKVKTTRAQESSSKLFQELPDQMIESQTPDKPNISIINNMLKSQKDRELDKIYAQSIKIQAERDLDQHPTKPETLNFVTDNYKDKKAEYERVQQLMLKEEKIASSAGPLEHSLHNSEGVASYILTKKDVGTPLVIDKPVEQNNASTVNEVNQMFHNDIYRPKSYVRRSTSSSENNLSKSQQMLQTIDKEVKLEATKEFLKSNIHLYNLDVLLKEYFSRVEKQRSSIER
ncbi:hypothetical protein TPHA_0N00520 [Tetrapisispora phaffii CBS 4417]|uniref:Nuclear speckle splicing regulatory protein 1 N-terminal domain-containing protein n=1 Tax=Tetrapisispora phaffii (strain ATCC 24235 / CBS 4417 / NBRC 1672 / NRRL Y-8282 / UCD 70-5) TaxID=1071381 RepID=G8C104_TETPH|nr:hypothetical protein TPHA_0N00520 [Tetrapisispora phaffii CBS 4417]CCE65832.1 hypothetical protein TPHA_0N00520 [Tetrapisispora phaffii CBS 4417]